MQDSPFFSKEGIKTPLQRLEERDYSERVERNNLLLEVIRELQPISKYALAKKTGLSYATVKQIVKEFEFCGLVHIKVVEGENGFPVKLAYIQEGEDED